MKRSVLMICALLLSHVMLASGLKLGLKAQPPTYKTYSQGMNLGVQVGEPETFKAEMPQIFQQELAPQDEESLKFGVLAGFLLSNLGGDFTEDYGFTPNALLGFYAIIAINSLFAVMPQLYYAGLGTTINNSTYDQKLRLGYLVLPILVMYALNPNWKVGIGPYFGFLLRARDKGNDFNEDVKDFVSGFDVGAKLAFYYQVSSYITFSAGYAHGLSNVQEGESSNFKQYNQAFMLVALINLTALMNR